MFHKPNFFLLLTSIVFLALSGGCPEDLAGEEGGDGNLRDVSSQLSYGIVEIVSTGAAFASLRENGSVGSWGSNSYGGDNTAVANELLSGVVRIFSNRNAFAVLKDDGSVITWGSNSNGGNSSSVSGQLASGVTRIFSTHQAFAALKENGEVVTWGDPEYGGDSSALVESLSSGVTAIFTTGHAFAALKDDGSVDIKNAVGTNGRVYLPIPPNREGTGQIQVVIQGREREVIALTDSDEELENRTRITVLKQIDPQTVLVGPIEAKTADDAEAEAEAPADETDDPDETQIETTDT